MHERQNNFLIITAHVTKQKYYSPMSAKLMAPVTSSKTYFSILKWLLNNTKIPSIPFLFRENKFVTDFKEKTEILICFLLNNKQFSNYQKFSNRNLCKSHSHDMISFLTLKILNTIYPSNIYQIYVNFFSFCGSSLYVLNYALISTIIIDHIPSTK